MLNAICRLYDSWSLSKQAMKQRWKEKGKASTAALHLPSATTNRHLALMSYERGDYTTSQALLQMSSWSESYLQQPIKPFFAGKLTAIVEAGVIKSLLASRDKRHGPKSR